MKTWLRNQISIDLARIAGRYIRDIGEEDEEILNLQELVVNIWTEAQPCIDTGNKEELTEACAAMSAALEEWENQAYGYASLYEGAPGPLLYARSIDRVHALLRTLARLLNLNEGQKPELP